MIKPRKNGRNCLDVKSEGYKKAHDYNRRLLIMNIDPVIIKNNKISGFLAKIESVLQNALNSIVFLDNFYNFTKDKKDF